MSNDLRWKTFVGKRLLSSRTKRAAFAVAAIVLIASGLLVEGLIKPARGAAVTQNIVPVASVSAASFVGSPAPLAPNSIVAAFGTQLATGTLIAPSQPLPTTLNGTTVTVNGTAAPLFFVSSGQVNYLAPPNLAVGDAQVVITSTLSNGDQVISKGQMKIASSAPALFTANSNGFGAPAAVTGRVNASGQFVFDPNPPFEADPLHPGQVVPAPVDVGTNDQPAFFILFGTGLRNASNVKALIGGVEVAVAPTAAPGFTGLDQINVQIPVSLKGSGIVDLTLVASGVSSNVVNVNLAGTPNNNLSITGFSVTDPALVGQTVNIQGSGFSTTANQNIVRFGGAEARVIAATASQLTVIIPFGAESGRVTVQTMQGETRSSGTFRVRTSISGMVQSTGSVSLPPAPLDGVTVRLVGANLSVRTNPQGSFVLPDLAPGGALIEVDGGTNNTNPPFPRVTLKTTVRPDRDNQFAQPISLQQINGGSGNVGGGPGVAAIAARGAEIFAALKQREPANANEPAEKEQTNPGKNITISNRGVTLEIPIGTGVRFPDGKTSGLMQLTVIEKSRLPGITPPVGVYSSNIAQITPLGSTFSPGASLSFPNPDQTNLGPGAKVDLFRYDFINGVFVKRGTATVSADRTRVVSDGRIVDVASFWFAGATTGVTTVTGRVINGLGFPVSGAIVGVNGRAARSDQNGGFSIPDVATAGVAQVQAEAVLPQQFGAPPRGTSSLTNVVANGVTNVGTIALSNTNQAGLVLSPFVIDFASNSPPAKLEVTLTQPAPTGGLAVALSTDASAVATVPASVTIPAGQTTASFNLTRVGPGVALIGARATLSGNALETIAIATVARSAPTLASVAPNSAAVGATITMTGSGLSSTADNNYVFFVRNGVIVGLPDPDQNQIVIDSQNRPALRVKVPGISAGAVNIVVAAIDDVTGVFTDPSAPIAFNVTASAIAAPRLTSVAPTSGKPRDQIRLNGSGFGPAPRDNRVVFNQSGQNGQTSEARILLAGPTQLILEVPGFNLTKGAATIYAQRIDANGAPSNQSNLLDFTITAEAAPPARPSITAVFNAQTQAPRGRDGETIRVLGTNFGTNYFILDTDSLFSDLPLITILLFYQNNQLVNFAIPNNAQDGTQLTALIPTGLSQGPVQITAATFDLETGLISDESLPFQDFSITVGSIRRIDEDEPNDSPDTATQVSIPLIVDGRAALGDFASLSIQFDDGTTERLHDLFFLPLDKTTAMTVTLNFNSPADLDLFILQRNADGSFSLVGRSTRKQSTFEQLSGSLPAGNYLIAVGAYSGSSRYSLSLTAGAGQTALEAGEMKKAVEVKR